MNKPQLSVLVIEDNLALGNQVCRFMEGLGWLVDYATTGSQGIELALNNHFDVIVLDLNLPDCDGLSVCESIREKQKRVIPILMLTARDAFEDKAKGFARGTDDYLTKPCDLRELALRCEALARRPKLHLATRVTQGQLSLDSRSHTVEWGGQLVKTTNIGFQILHQLLIAFPYPVTRSDLIEQIWGQEPPQSNVLKSHMYSLRKSLEQISQRQPLKTISSLGYQLQDLE